jgi:hypothetical protein
VREENSKPEEEEEEEEEEETSISISIKNRLFQSIHAHFVIFKPTNQPKTAIKST